MPPRLLMLCAGLLLPWQAAALEGAPDEIRWNGFLNVVGGMAKVDPFSPQNPQGLFSDSSYSKDFE